MLDTYQFAIEQKWQEQCREEDILQRKLENERRAIDDARRCVDEKSKQLESLATQSALMAGFSLVALVEVTIPEGVNSKLLTIYGICVTICVALMLTAMLNATFIHVAILRYDTVKREPPFPDFWRRRCDEDWRFALNCFMYGIPMFMVLLALASWILFVGHAAQYYAAGSVTAITCVTLLYFIGYTNWKWRGFLLSGKSLIIENRHGEASGHAEAEDTVNKDNANIPSASIDAEYDQLSIIRKDDSI